MPVVVHDRWWPTVDAFQPDHGAARADAHLDAEHRRIGTTFVDEFGEPRCVDDDVLPTHRNQLRVVRQRARAQTGAVHHNVPASIGKIGNGGLLDSPAHPCHFPHPPPEVHRHVGERQLGPHTRPKSGRVVRCTEWSETGTVEAQGGN